MKYFIKDKNTIDVKKWDHFVLSHPFGNIFQTPEMFEVYSLSKKHEPILVCVEDSYNDIVGILLAVILKEYNGILGFFSSRSIIWGGPLIKDDNKEILNFLLQEYVYKIKHKAIYSQFRNFRDWGIAKKIYENHGFLFEEHLNIHIDLTEKENELWNACSRDRKKSIKKGLSGLSIEEMDMSKSMDEIYNLLFRVYNRIKLPVPDKSFFFNAFQMLGNKGYLRAFGVYKDSYFVGVRLVLCYKECIYDWYAGADDSFLENRPNDVLPWHIFLWGKQNAFKVFDFGGAGKPNVPYGVRDYKLKFGGQLVSFGRFELIHKPVLYRLGIIGLFLFKFCHGIFKSKSK